MRGGSANLETASSSQTEMSSPLAYSIAQSAAVPSPMVKRGRSSDDCRFSPGRSSVYVGTTSLGATRRVGMGGSVNAPVGGTVTTSQSVAAMPANTAIVVTTAQSNSARGNRSRLLTTAGQAVSPVAASASMVAQPPRRTPRGMGTQASPVRHSAVSISPQKPAVVTLAKQPTSLGGHRGPRAGLSLTAPSAASPTSSNQVVGLAQPCSVAASTMPRAGIVIPRLDLQKARH